LKWPHDPHSQEHPCRACVGADLPGAGHPRRARGHQETHRLTANLAKNYHDLAIEATTLGQDQLITWSGIGNVRVLNLFGDTSFTQHAQDQLYMIPEPASYSLMLGALGLMGLLARRRRTSAA
jgi:hypothetical protein